MKKSTIAIVIGLIAIGLYGCHAHRQQKKTAAAGPASNVQPEIPATFAVSDNAGNITKYWKDGERFMSQLTGATVKSVPVAITAAEYRAAFQAYKA